MHRLRILFFISSIAMFCVAPCAFGNNIALDAKQVQQRVSSSDDLPFGAGFEDDAELAASRWEKHEQSLKKADFYGKLLGNAGYLLGLYVTKDVLSDLLWKSFQLMKVNSVMAAKDIASLSFKFSKFAVKRIPIVLFISIIFHTKDDQNSSATHAGYFLNNFDKFIDLYLENESPDANEYTLGFLLIDAFKEHEDVQLKKLRERVFEYRPTLKEEYLRMKREIKIEIFMKKQDEEKLRNNKKKEIEEDKYYYDASL